ncbi:hypothetical protein SMACR_02742 [Sordaria macrospora]|uniref:WGS project CABT00000000 data, contig 2.11 n=2 Tax=Sordaria macrospora TaxID=5147 RepID=F7VXC2_SORMK|nr:uncharacterized protein SMAC_02742 [Sordaria macrospora k-hell]KAA8636320.1 hypothetical protein SMACR_02742 [Sordaria macrospora]KAH7633131.1 hypothetical protein B0T09DRAFT_86634 [Sordaria sp. MPI-SDFR-AT-0083]WPJ60426.1 hypothetical protein SMAC4_02742 [Sordaria macrospora]CCC10164.1 unnamed protein product [Sordaria macrospora k-hell]
MPSSQDKKPLRQLAAEKLNGPDANPSQLGDPISLKSETNQDSPNNVEYTPEGAEVSPSSSSNNKSLSKSDHNRTQAYGTPRNDPAGGKAATSSGGWGGNPRTSSGKRVPLEGDPTSMEREQVVSDGRRVREEENGPVGRGRRGSKL